MKKRTILCIGLSLIILLLFNGCNSIDNEPLKINDEVFEIVYGDWTPYGDSRYDGEYYLYEKNSKIIFAESNDNNLFEGIVYHNKNDVYPDISMTDQIDKIVFETDKKQIVLEDAISESFLNEILNTNSSNEKIVSANVATMKIFVDVYYKDYPAFQNEIALCYSNSGDLGYIYCNSQKNTNRFGSGNMFLFSDEQLISYIESLNVS